MTTTTTTKPKSSKAKVPTALSALELIRKRIPAWEAARFFGDEWEDARDTLKRSGGGQSHEAGWLATSVKGLQQEAGFGDKKVVLLSLTWVQVRDLIRSAHPARIQALQNASKAVREKHPTFPVFKAPAKAQGCGFPKDGEPLTEAQQIMEDARQAHAPIEQAWRDEMAALRETQDQAYADLWKPVTVFQMDGREYVLAL